MANRTGTSPHGKYDDVIDWLKWLEGAMLDWAHGHSVPGAISRLNEYPTLERAIGNEGDEVFRITALKGRDMWFLMSSIYTAFVQALERTNATPPYTWSQYILNIQKVRHFYEQNNAPAHSPKWE